MVEQKPAAALAATGIRGLDILLEGGLPRNRLYLLEGDTGTGKTTFGLQFALAGVSQGERVLYVTLSETEEELQQVAACHGWSLQGLQVYELQSTEEHRDPDSGYTLFHPSEMEMGEGIGRLLQKLEEIQPLRLVIDTISGLRLLADDALHYRKQIQMLRHYLNKHRCTALLLDESFSGAETAQARVLAHGVITLERLIMVYGAARRRLHIHKLRGVEYLDSYHDFRIFRDGIKVFPRLVPEQHQEPVHQPKSNLLDSGIQELDTMLGGGLVRGHSALLMGPAGTGKSTLAMQYAAATAERGERSLVFLFEESPDDFVKQGEAMGIGLKQHVDRGHVILEQIHSTSLSPGEFWDRVHYRLEQEAVHLVVFDSLSGYLHAMPEERFLSLHFQELLTYLNHQSVVTLLTMVQPGVIGTDLKPPLDLSTIADTVVLLRYFEAEGEVHKAISVLKHRRNPHQKTIRELHMADSSLRIGQPLHGLQGILTGVPEYTGSSDPLFKGE